MGVKRRPVRGEVYLVALGPSRGREIKKTRPCLVVSPDELNRHLSTVIVAPLTTAGHRYPFRITCRFQRRKGYVVLDQLRTVDAARLLKRLGVISKGTLRTALSTLQEMFQL